MPVAKPARAMVDPPWPPDSPEPPWQPESLDPPWLPGLPDPPWRPSLSPPCSCTALTSEAPAPPTPVELLRRGMRL